MRADGKSTRLRERIKPDLKPIIGKDRLWSVRELPRLVHRGLSIDGGADIVRDVEIATIDEQGEVTGHERTQTLKLTESDAVVTSTLEVASGQFVVLSPPGGASLLGVVRDSYQDDARQTHFLQVEFLSGKWTIE